MANPWKDYKEGGEPFAALAPLEPRSPSPPPDEPGGLASASGTSDPWPGAYPVEYNMTSFLKDKANGVIGAQGTYNDYMTSALQGTLDQPLIYKPPYREPWFELATPVSTNLYGKNWEVHKFWDDELRKNVHELTNENDIWADQFDFTERGMKVACQAEPLLGMDVEAWSQRRR